MSSPYRPWMADRRRAVALLYVVPWIALIGLNAAGASWGVIIAVTAASVLAGLHFRRRAGAREYGKVLEQREGPRAAHFLRQAGFDVEEGRMTRVGDIDLLVRIGARTATVEIKAFHFWRSRWRDMGRQRAARRQARRQRAVVGADIAVIWLPRARPTTMTRILNAIFPERRPRVVIGGVKALRETLQKQLEN